MTWQFTPIIFLYTVSAVLCSVLAYRIWQMRPRPARGATWAISLLIGCTIWATGSALEVSLADLASKLIVVRFVLYFGVTMVVFSWSVFAIEYSAFDRWLNKYTIAALAVVPTLAFIAVTTNPLHYLFHAEYNLARQAGVTVMQNPFGPLFWVWAGYAYIATFGGSVLLLISMARYPHMYRGQAATLIIGCVVPLVSNILYVSGFNPVDPFDPSSIAFTITGLMISYSIRRFGFLNVVPVAHDLVIQNVTSGVVIFDQRGHVMQINPAAERILNRKQEEVQGKASFEAFPEYTDLLKEFRSVMEIKTEIALGDHVYELQITPLTNRSGKVSGRIVLLYDITDKVRLIEELDTYARTVAHDLKTPLTSIDGYLQLLEQSGEWEGDQKRYIDTMGRGTQRIVKIIDGLLVLANVRTLAEVPSHKIDMKPIVGEVNDRMAALVNDSKATVTMPEAWPPALGYAPWIEEVWANYISNAIKYGGSPPKIELGADSMDGKVRFWVRDNGNGLDTATKEQLFTAFARFDKSRAEGHGLGLSIVQRIVGRLGGEVGVDSELGKGSTFWFKLPSASS